MSLIGIACSDCRVSQALPISVNLRKDSLTEVYDILNVRGAMNCATTNAFMEVYDILNVRGAMNCATTNKEARELRDYERVYGGVNERGVFFFR